MGMLYQVGCFLRTGLLASVLLLQFAQAAPNEPTSFAEGVTAYREGRYLDAEKCFQQIRVQHPEDSKTTYYLAITQAQLGRFKQAKALYQEVLTLDPNSESAKLAKEGLLFLPEGTNLDSPPRFQSNSKAVKDNPSVETQTGTTPPAVTSGMSPQDMMTWQMMMAQMGGNQQQGGANPWAYMMPQMTGDPNAPKVDPSVMSNMLMNQMMQNFNLDGNKQDNQ